MYDELINKIRHCATDPMHCLSCAEDKDGRCFTRLMTQAADAIEELTDNHVGKWIPVTERLPEFNQKVLALVKNKDPNGLFNKDGIYTAVLRNKVPKHDPEGKKNFWGLPGYDSVWTVWAWSYFTEPDVLCWMPLPEPPKEE